MESILIVDRDPGVHDALTPVFQARGWSVDSCFDPAEALGRLQTEPFDLVVADPTGLENDGCDWLRRVRLLRPETKVVMLASEPAPARVICAMRDRAFVYFTKPPVPRVVADFIDQAFTVPSWEDDIEVLSAKPHWITLRVRCKLETADRLVQFLRELKMDLPPEQREDVASALRELLLNAIEHGAHSDPQKRVIVSSIRTGRAIVYHIQDPGPGFSFDQIGHAAVGNPESDPVHHLEVREEMGVRPGGFGILLTRNLVDELIYNEKGNEVLFIKYLKK